MAKNDGEIIIEVKLEQEEMKRKIAELEQQTMRMSDTVAGSGKGFTILKGTMANLVSQGISKVSAGLNKLKGDLISNAATVKAQNAQYEQTFGTMESTATKAIHSVSSSAGILDTRLKETGTRMFAFARTTGMQGPQALDLMKRALKVTADQAAYYDRSLESVSESLQSFLKGNYENDAALGLSCTETTRNAAANKLYGKSFMELSEAQKQLTLLQMVEDANALSGALGQAARESDGWENVLGNLNETYRQFTSNLGIPILEAIIPVIQDLTAEFQEWSASIDWKAYGEDCKAFFSSFANGAGAAIKAFPKLINYTKKAIPLVVGLGTAYATIKGAQKINEIIGPTKQFVSLLKNGNGLINTFAIMSSSASTKVANFGASIVAAGGGLKGLSTVLMGSMGPVGWAIAAVGALAAGTISWAYSLRDTSAMAMETKSVTEELGESMDELSESVVASREAFNDQLDAVETNYQNAQLLTEQIDLLASKENKSASEKAKLKALVDELNGVIPDLNLQYNEEADSLNMSTDAIYRKVEAMKYQAQQEAYMAQYKETIKQVAEAEANLAKIQAEQATNEQKRLEIKKQLNEVLKEGTIEYSNAQVELGKLDKEKADLIEKEKEAKQALSDTKKEMEAMSDLVDGKFVPATDEIKAKFEELSQACYEAGIEIPQSVSDGIMEGQYVLPETIEEMKALIEFDSLITSVGEKGIEIPAALSQGIADGSISLASGIEQMNNWINFQTAISKAGLQGVQIPAELAAGVLSGKTPVDAAIAQLKNSVDTGTADTGKAQQNGQKTSDSFGKGLGANPSVVTTAAKTVTTKATDEMGRHTGEARTAGQNISNGLASGISSMATSVANSAASVARQAIAAAKAALDERSPSKIFRQMGVFAWMGYNEGQEAEAPNVQKYSRKNALSSIEATKRAIRNADYGDSRLRNNFHNSAYISSTPSGFGRSYQVNQTFNGTGIPDPVTAAREARNMMVRLEWQKS